MVIDGVVIPANCAVEVTFRTLQQRFLLRPDEDATEILAGCFGRAYDRYPDLNLIVSNVISNHGAFIALPSSAYVLSDFMRDFLSTAARKLNGLRGREGTFWERRYRAIPIADEAMLEDRFRYVLTQGTKENLVWSAREWPGFNSARALTGGPPLVGRWRDGTAECALRRQRRRKLERAAARGRQLELPEVEPVWIEYPIEHVPLPHWQHLTAEERHARVADILARDEARTRERHQRDGTRPLGVRELVRVSPFDRPAEPKKSPAPLVHASTKRVRKAFHALYRAFLEELAESRERATQLLGKLRLPPNATLPPLSHREQTARPQLVQAKPDRARARAPDGSLDPPASAGAA